MARNEWSKADVSQNNTSKRMQVSECKKRVYKSEAKQTNARNVNASNRMQTGEDIQANASKCKQASASKRLQASACQQANANKRLSASES